MRTPFKLFSILAILTLAVASFAQTTVTKSEVFTGYSYGRTTVGNVTGTANGGVASYAYNFNPSSPLIVSAVGEVGGYYNANVIPGVSARVFTYLGGAKLSTHVGKFTPFAQALFGDVNVNLAAGGTYHPTYSTNAFASTYGGGLDYQLTKHIGIRVAQVDYLLTKVANGSQNGLRVSSGLTFSF